MTSSWHHRRRDEPLSVACTDWRAHTATEEGTLSRFNQPRGTLVCSAPPPVHHWLLLMKHWPELFGLILVCSVPDPSTDSDTEDDDEGNYVNVNGRHVWRTSAAGFLLHLPLPAVFNSKCWTEKRKWFVSEVLKVLLRSGLMSWSLF